MENINWIDGLLLFVLLLSSALGLFRGLIRGVFGIISLVVAFFIARQFGEKVGAAMIPLLGQSAFTVVVGYVLSFLMSALVLGALTNILSRAAAKADLGMTDKFGGLLFGGLRGGIISLFIVMMLSFLPLQKSAAWRESTMVPVFGQIIKLSLNAPPLAEYRSYWRFGGDNRPRFALQNLDLGTASDAADRIRQRDDLLDSLNDQILEQSVNKNATAEENARRGRDAVRQSSALQEIVETVQTLFGGGECAGDECDGR